MANTNAYTSKPTILNGYRNVLPVSLSNHKFHYWNDVKHYLETNSNAKLIGWPYSTSGKLSNLPYSIFIQKGSND